MIWAQNADTPRSSKVRVMMIWVRNTDTPRLSKFRVMTIRVQNTDTPRLAKVSVVTAGVKFMPLQRYSSEADFALVKLLLDLLTRK